MLERNERNLSGLRLAEGEDKKMGEGRSVTCMQTREPIELHSLRMETRLSDLILVQSDLIHQVLEWLDMGSFVEES